MANNIRRGQIYDLDWSPRRGSEQAGVRPALVMQNDVANSVESYAVTIVLALSSKLKGYPSMVLLHPSQENGLTRPSEVNTSQILTVARDRLTTLRGYITDDEMKMVENKLVYMLGLHG